MARDEPAELPPGAARQRQPEARRDAKRDAVIARARDHQNVVGIDRDAGGGEARGHRALADAMRAGEDHQPPGKFRRGAVEAEQRRMLGDVGRDQIEDEGADDADFRVIVKRFRQPRQLEAVALAFAVDADDRVSLR